VEQPRKVTPEVLQAYSSAALENASELLAEASLLLDHGHNARAYFLAVSCIEEIGKALQAFDAQKRNLSDPAVVSRLRNRTEDHGHKIVYAFSAWIGCSKNPREAIEAALGLIAELKRGRDPSLYTDLPENSGQLQLPRAAVRDAAARDCVRLARDCLAVAVDHIKSKEPFEASRSDDKLYTMKRGRFSEILSAADFWWYFIAQREAGKSNFSEAVLSYEKEYLMTRKQFTRN
jgi:AbiV family abortive infection protein